MIKENKIILFMKGSKDFPQCGFSNTAVQVLQQCGAKFETVNVLENENIRQGIKQYSNWPTIPQVCCPSTSSPTNPKVLSSTQALCLFFVNL